MITLAEAQVNAQDDVDFAVIDELRRSSWLLDQVTWDDVVNPSGGGTTLTYGYTRLTETRGAGFRTLNKEYEPEKAKRERKTAYLSPLGGSYTIDRVLAHLGPQATDEMAFQVSELLNAVRVGFAAEMIRGDQEAAAIPREDGVTGEYAGFDGLDKALTGTVTEVGTDEVTDWSSIADEAAAHDAIEGLEAMLSLLNGQPDAILTNRLGVLRLNAIGRRAGYLSNTEDAFGRTMPTFAGVPFLDIGDTNAYNAATGGATEPIIPVEDRTVGAGTETGLTDIYAVRFGLNGYHGAATTGALVQQFPPDFSTPGAVKTGEVEMGPVAMVLKHSRAAGVLRNVRVKGVAA